MGPFLAAFSIPNLAQRSGAIWSITHTGFDAGLAHGVLIFSPTRLPNRVPPSVCTLRETSP